MIASSYMRLLAHKDGGDKGEDTDDTDYEDFHLSLS